MGIAGAALILMAGNVASRLLGLVREQVIAALFGASAATDAFTAASRVPTTVYDLLIGGMLSAAFVPVFSDYAEGDDELWRLASATINLALLLLALTTAVLVVVAPPLMVIYAAGFDTETQALSVVLVRFMLPAIVFMGMSGVFAGLLYSRRRFVLPAFGVAAYNSGLVAVAILLHRSLAILSLVAGVLTGAVLQAALQLPGLRRIGFTWHWQLSHPDLRRMGGLYLPVALGLVVSAVGVAIDSNLASRTGEGSMAAMRFATTLIQFPLGLVASAASLALLPTLSRYASEAQSGAKDQSFFDASVAEVPLSDEAARTGRPLATPLSSARLAQGSAAGLDAYRSTLFLGLRGMLLVILPATVGLAVLRKPVIRLLFQRGAFDAEATARTALAFLCYSPGLPAAAIDQLLIFAFYARKNTVAPVVVGVLAVGVYLTVGLALIGPLGMPGLALANSAQWVFHAIVMLALLRWLLGSLAGSGLAGAASKGCVASTAMGLAVAGGWFWMEGVAQGEVGLALCLALVCVMGAAIYGGLLLMLRVPEAGLMWRMARDRLGWPS